jgi:hypothetical protein
MKCSGNWRSLSRAARMLLPLLAMLFVTGCLSTPKTRIGETEAAIVADVCRVWLPVTYSSRDTAETVLEARANNAARSAYCGEKP